MRPACKPIVISKEMIEAITNKPFYCECKYIEIRYYKKVKIVKVVSDLNTCYYSCDYSKEKFKTLKEIKRFIKDKSE